MTQTLSPNIEPSALSGAAEAKTRLLAARNALLDQAIHLSGQDNQLRSAHAADARELLAEGDTVAVERALLQRISASGARSLHEIDDALGRISLGTYGICVRCAGPVGAERLDARPHAAACRACA